MTKSFGAQTAVDDLSLAVPERTIYGFIGPNGSGKTTTLRMIMRLFQPDRGTVAVLGAPNKPAVDDRVAYLPEERGLYKQMTVSEVLEYYAALKGMARADSRAEITRWLERLELAAHAKKRVSALSKGMSQKVQFIATVVARPELVLLDEPFSGLDPVNAVVLRDAILELRKTSTVIFSTHDMSAAEALCDFIFMIHRGKKVLDGTLAEIKSAYGRDTLRVKVGDGVGLDGLSGVHEVTDLGNLQELRIGEGAEPQRILRQLLDRGDVHHFEVAQPSLHEIFVRIAKPEPERADA
ncbi:MAG: ATP-binding cassette domain-containing protein [Myxococcales bacterium]|nr:ATP-binding cassette domain-containing protein [Myxococcales bacterium]